LPPAPAPPPAFPAEPSDPAPAASLVPAPPLDVLAPVPPPPVLPPLLDDPPLPGTVEPLPLELQADRPKNRIRKPMRNRGELSMTLLPERGSTIFNGAEHPIVYQKRDAVFQPLGTRSDGRRPHLTQARLSATLPAR
jgi:hypothetical protein